MMRRLLVVGSMAMTVSMAACDDRASELESEIEIDREDAELGIDEGLAAAPAPRSSYSPPEVTVVAWTDGDDIRATAYCTAYDLYAADTTRCTCDGLDGLGWTGYDSQTGADIKCKMCRDGDGWPCSLEPSSEREVALTFAASDTVALYSYVDEADHNTRIDTETDGAWMLSCDEPPASCHHTCDPGGEPCTCAEDRLEFAVSRPYWSNGERHMAARGGMIVDLGSACD